MTAAISLDRIQFDYDGHAVLSGFHLSVEKGQIVALLGPSGCGKTTVLRLILGLTLPRHGSVRLDDAVVTEGSRLVVPPEERELAVVFQDLALWPNLSVGGNLRFVLGARRVPRGEGASRIAAILERLGLADKLDRYPGDLSGGERQRVAIARALVLDPRAVLLDEPLSNVDVTLKHELLSLFRTLFQERGSTAIYVTHDLREAASLGDRIAVMESGRVVQVGTLDDLRENPASAFVRGLVDDLRWHQPPHARP
jgi:iron(III) transport system ATP-binding protein